MHSVHLGVEERQPVAEAQRSHQDFSHRGRSGYLCLEAGHNRIKEELIPYLIEIIEQMDNDNEFLIKVCEGILDLKQFCRTPD